MPQKELKHYVGQKVLLKTHLQSQPWLSVELVGLNGTQALIRLRGQVMSVSRSRLKPV